MFRLGAAEPETYLPGALGFWRDVGRAFVVRLCATEDLEALRAKIEVEVPPDELAALAAAAPPMTGGEYLTPTILADLCARMATAVRDELATWDGTVEAFLRQASPAWNLVGRVCFHLAENKNDPDAPFAFLATYTTRLSTRAKAQHLPLAQALREYAGARNKAALLALLEPVQRAARTSAVAKDLVDGGAVFETLAWTPAEAHRFLTEVPHIEAAGVVVRMPAAWRAKRPPRPEVQVTLGKAPGKGIGADAILDFSIDVTLEGETLTERELRAILDGTDGLALVRGRWVEVDHERLRQVLDRWSTFEEAHAAGGLSVVEGLRLLAGAHLESRAVPERAVGDVAEWSKVVAGESLAKALAGLRSPETLADLDPGPSLRAELRPYQKVGLRWLWWLQEPGSRRMPRRRHGAGQDHPGDRAARAAEEERQRRERTQPAGRARVADRELAAEIARFAPSLGVFVAHPSEVPPASSVPRRRRRSRSSDVVITTYGTLQRVAGLASANAWNVVVLDEAQAIKNPGAKQTRAVKTLRAKIRLALTGTPVENRLGDLWSLFDFTCPGLLGSPKAFGRFVKSAEKRAHGGYGPLRELVRPYILRRLKTDKRVIADLPDKTEVTRVLWPHEEAGRPLSTDGGGAATGATERRWHEAPRGRPRIAHAAQTNLQSPVALAGDGSYAPAESGKFARLAELADEIAARQEKALIFTQFREMTRPLAELSCRRLWTAGPCALGGDGGQEAHGACRAVSAGGRPAVLRSLAESRRHRSQPHGRPPRDPLRSLVEPRRREPGDGPRVSHRPEERGAGAQVRLPRHRRGEDRCAHRV